MREQPACRKQPLPNESHTGAGNGARLLARSDLAHFRARGPKTKCAGSVNSRRVPFPRYSLHRIPVLARGTMWNMRKLTCLFTAALAIVPLACAEEYTYGPDSQRHAGVP